MNKEQQKQLITEIMDLDAKDGLYEDEDAMEKLRSRNYLEDATGLDAFHYHEILDRLTIINEMIENCLISHPVCEKHSQLKDAIEKAQDALGDAYLELGSLIY